MHPSPPSRLASTGRFREEDASEGPLGLHDGPWRRAGNPCVRWRAGRQWRHPRRRDRVPAAHPGLEDRSLDRPRRRHHPPASRVDQRHHPARSRGRPDAWHANGQGPGVHYQHRLHGRRFGLLPGAERAHAGRWQARRHPHHPTRPGGRVDRPSDRAHPHPAQRGWLLDGQGRLDHGGASPAHRRLRQAPHGPGRDAAVRRDRGLGPPSGRQAGRHAQRSPGDLGPPPRERRPCARGSPRRVRSPRQHGRAGRRVRGRRLRQLGGG
mmetsp:Transcript_24909/g.51501  ORF Transcript_24909/g.51501 Transcript_24909/m.51501 type:complete len:266 (+) Transcript_24909:869-1666(+)